MRTIKKAILLAAVFLAAACCQGKREMVSFGPDAKASLVVVLKEGSSQKEIDTLFDTAFVLGHVSGNHWHRPGIWAIVKVGVGDHEAYAITFGSDATQQQRDAVKTAVSASPVVYKIFENQAPIDIRLDDASLPARPRERRPAGTPSDKRGPRTTWTLHSKPAQESTANPPSPPP
jgi:hypothetical protein